MERFLPNQGNYQSLIVFQKAECIYDITYYFVHKFLAKGDRTIDQMIQAARSGKQNIAEGSAASATSSETELKLTNVAKASLHELLVDYEDFLRVRKLQQWATDDPRSVQTRPNIAITLIHQEDYMLRKLIDRLQDDFVKNGGIKERMYQARINYRNRSGGKKEE